jgi:hypothetical protein
MKFRAILPIFVILLTACTKPNANLPKVKLADYTFETIPNNIDNVGYVFAISDNQEKIPVSILNVKTIDGDAVIPTKSSSKLVSLAAILKFTGLEKLQLKAGVGINNQNKVNVVFAVNEPKLSRALLTDIDEAIDKSQQKIESSLRRHSLENAKLYVVSETIKSSKLVYDFNKSNLGNGSLEATFKEVISTGDSLKWDGRKIGSLSYDLKKEMIVFYKIFQINVEPGGTRLKFRRGASAQKSELVYTTSKNYQE